MALYGKDALEFHEELKRREAERRKDELKHAKVAAIEKGKEPFDLEALERLCDTSHEGRLDPVEVRRAELEEKYYVDHPEIKTIAEFAAYLEEINKW